MNEKINAAIDVLLGKITGDIKGDEALKLTQAVANLAHAKSVMKATDA
jgi:hypothetical protein